MDGAAAIAAYRRVGRDDPQPGHVEVGVAGVGCCSAVLMLGGGVGCRAPRRAAVWGGAGRRARYSAPFASALVGDQGAPTFRLVAIYTLLHFAVFAMLGA